MYPVTIGSTRQVDIAESFADTLFKAQTFAFAPPRKVDKLGIHAASAQQEHGVVRTVRFTDTADQLAHRHQVLVQFEVAIAADALQIDQAVAHTFDTFLHETISKLAIRFIAECVGIDAQHVALHSAQRITPCPVVFRTGIQRIDARLGRFLVFQQHVSNAAISRNNDDPVIQIISMSGADQDIAKDRVDIQHRGAADLVNGVRAILS